MNFDNDQIILKKCVEPCQKECLVQEYWELVYYTIRKTFSIYNVHQIKDDIESLRNEVFIQLFRNNCRKFKQYCPDLGNGLNAWVKLITSRIVQNHITKKDPFSIGTRNKLISIDDLDAFIELTDPETEKKTKKKDDQHQKIMQGMKQLKPKDHMVLKLYYYDGYSIEDIAKILNISRGAVDTKKSRAMERLKAVMVGCEA